MTFVLEVLDTYIKSFHREYVLTMAAMTILKSRNDLFSQSYSTDVKKKCSPVGHIARINDDYAFWQCCVIRDFR